MMESEKSWKPHGRIRHEKCGDCRMENEWSVRQAIYDDIPNIMRFIREHWAREHILGNDRAFLEYEMCAREDVHYVVAENRNTGALEGILGFIPYGRENCDIMLALWKNAAQGAPMLGVRLLEYLCNNSNIRTVACVGINKRTRGIYEYVGFTTGELQHYYRLGNFAEYRIAVIKDKIIPPVSSKGAANLIKVTSMAELLKYFDWDQYRASGVIPYKEPWYIEKRYFDHPIYTYDVYAVERSGMETNTVIVAREQECRGGKVLRIVDALGDTDTLADCGAAIQELLDHNGYEYVDFYEYGISDEIMQKAGFTAQLKENIIPNYFSPFVQQEIPIYYCSNSMDNFRVFKGDGDQDRPNARI